MKTFVVRLYVPVDPLPPSGTAGLHGVVQEIGSSRTVGFADGTELLAFLATPGPLPEAEPSERSLS